MPFKVKKHVADYSIACSFTHFKNSVTTQSEVIRGLNTIIAECCMASVSGSLVFFLIA